MRSRTVQPEIRSFVSVLRTPCHAICNLTEATKNANCFEEYNVFMCNGSVTSAPFKRGVREKGANFWQGKVQNSSPILRCTFWQGKVQNSSPISALLKAYSFCAVFLFRFINRNRNMRVQKERLSFERNNFHGNKKAQCLISNWKGKKVRKHYTKTKFKRKIPATFSTDSLSSPTPLYSSFFLVSLRTCIHGYQQEVESCCWVDSRPFRREKRWERCGTRRGIVCCAFDVAEAVLRRRRARRNCFPGCSRRQAKNENVDAPA